MPRQRHTLHGSSVIGRRAFPTKGCPAVGPAATPAACRMHRFRARVSHICLTYVPRTCLKHVVVPKVARHVPCTCASALRTCRFGMNVLHVPLRNLPRNIHEMSCPPQTVNQCSTALSMLLQLAGASRAAAHANGNSSKSRLLFGFFSPHTQPPATPKRTRRYHLQTSAATSHVPALCAHPTCTAPLLASTKRHQH